MQLHCKEVDNITSGRYYSSFKNSLYINVVFVTFIGHTKCQISSLTKYFVMSDLKTLFPIKLELFHNLSIYQSLNSKYEEETLNCVGVCVFLFYLTMSSVKKNEN